MTSKIATITLNPAIDHTASIANFQAGEVNRVDWEQIDPGGKGVNVASFLSEFGHAIAVSGFLGKQNAELFQNFFVEKKIENRFVYIPGHTRVNIKIIDPAQDQVTDINFPGQSPTESDIELLNQAIDDLMLGCDWFVVSGSIPAGISSDIYATFVDRLKAKGKTVVLDASGEGLRQAIPFAPYAIKPNLKELEELVNRSLESDRAIVEAVQTLLAQGIQCVVVSMGAKGAIFAEADEIIHARPPRVEVVSTVGAGDAMVSGFVAGKLQNFSLSDCARLATAFSIATLSQVGPRLPPRATIEALMNQVDITQPLQHQS